MSLRTYYGNIAAGSQFTLSMVGVGYRPGGKGCLCFHGHAADATQYADIPANVGESAAMLAKEADYAVMSMSAGGTSWGNAAAMTAASNAYAYLTSTSAFLAPGASATAKIGVIGWSMGALGALNWIKRNPTKVAWAWLWAPVIDLRWVDRLAGYTPAWTPSFVATTAWQAEVNAAFPGGIVGVGYDPMQEPASWRGLGIPITVCRATDDITVPPASSAYFVSQVNDPLVKLRTPDITGGHAGLFQNVPVGEVVAFANSHR